MTPDVIKELNYEGSEPSEFLTQMLTESKQKVKMSRGHMAKYYDKWDDNSAIYCGERPMDREDQKQQERGKPTKMVVPNSFAQVQTFTSFLFLMFNQNRTFYELNPTGDEDALTKRRDCELVLQQNLRQNQFNTLLYQLLTHTSIFAISPIECEWVRKTVKAKVTPQPMMVNVAGQQIEVRSGSEWQDFIKYEGNQISLISPYRWFPDTRLPWTEFNKGEFCGHETEYSMSELRRLEANGDVAGVDKIQPLSTSWVADRGAATRTVADFSVRTFNRGPEFSSLCGSAAKEGPVIVTKLKRWIVPNKFKFGSPEKALGPEEHPVLYHIWYANDNTIIRCEPADEWHSSFGVGLSQFTPDMHQTLSGMSLTSLIDKLQEVVSWFINSHVRAVNRVNQNRLVVNHELVEPRTLDGEGDIYLRKGFGRRSAQEAVSQLDFRDVTGAHMGDAQMLQGIMQFVTGVNENFSGQYNGGRRSAQEARTVAAGAAGRMKLHGHLIWEQALAPLGQFMLSNLRQSLSENIFNRIIGSAAQQDSSRYQAFIGTPEEVICGDDFFVFDSTLSSEKGFMAQQLSELLSAMMSANPMIAAQLSQRIDPTKVVDEIQFLRGGVSTSRFAYTPGTQPQPAMPQALPSPMAQLQA